MRKMSADPSRMKSAGNRAVVRRRLQMLHIHVFLVAPLSACHVAEPCADQPASGRSYHPTIRVLRRISLLGNRLLCWYWSLQTVSSFIHFPF
nr:MAG TPA: hypothetical protein [Caudoviricetes sp.]